MADEVDGEIPHSSISDVGLHDLCAHGWFANDTGHVYPGMPIGPDDIVVDIGCGDGGIAQFCARQGAHVILCDLDAPRLEAARQRIAASAKGPVEARHGNGEALPIESSLASRTICTEVVEHVEDPKALLAELYRVTRPGGLLLIACPDPRAEAVQEKVAPAYYFQHPNHIRIVSHEDFSRYVTQAGFAIERTDTYGFYSMVWWTMFWRCGIALGESHPMLDAWATSWWHLLEAEGGRDVQRALDDTLPKSQIIIARKPEQAGQTTVSATATPAFSPVRGSFLARLSRLFMPGRRGAG